MKNKKEKIASSSNAVAARAYKKRKRYRRKRKSKAFIVVTLASLLLCVCAVFIFQYLRIGVIDSITIDSGDTIPKAESYFTRTGINAEFISEVPDCHKPGEYQMKVRNGILVYTVELVIKDDVPPKAKTKNIRMKQGSRTIEPKDFLRDIQDQSEVTASFKKPLDENLLGDTYVTVVLTDAGGNSSEFTALLTVFPKELKTSLTVEAGTPYLTLEDFFEDEAENVKTGAIMSEKEELDFNHVETKEIRLLYDDVVYTVPVKVVDTVIPAGYVNNQRTYQGTKIPASDFISKFFDATDVTVSYEQEPDFSQVGAKVITIILEDEGGNKQEYKVTLYVNPDVTAPVIEAESRTVYIGDNIRFTEGVTAWDNNDEDVKLTVDASKFDKETPGYYPITFKAEDKAGNSAEKTVYFELREKVSQTVDQWVIDGAFEALYKEIVNDSMTQKQKMRAIYDYIRENISFSGTSDKTDYQQEAYRGITDLSGDSFTFYSVSRILLTLAGVENKGAQRKGNGASHYWNLVKVGEKWLHFDTCPHYKDFPLDSFLLTDEQVKAYSEKTNGYYNYKVISEQ